jgi:hypothetical protein
VTVPGPTFDRSHELVVGTVGVIGTWMTLPGALGYYSVDAAFASGAVTWSTGVLLLAVGMRRVVRRPRLVESVGAVAMLGGAALTGAQFAGVAPILGVATAIGLIALGAVPDHVLLSAYGSLGVLINVPWAIGHFFPGGNRAPLLILITGLLIVLVALWVARLGGRFRSELGGRHR